MNTEKDEIQEFLASEDAANMQKWSIPCEYNQDDSRVYRGLFGADKIRAQEGARIVGGVLSQLIAEYNLQAGTRKIRANHRSVTGWIARDHSSDPIPFESTLERDFAYLALFEPRIINIYSQPLSLQYKDETGAECTYTPDFLVEYTSSSNLTAKAIVEVKYSAELEKNGKLYENRFNAMDQWCQSNSHEFHVVTDQQIRTTHIENVKALYPFRFAEGANQIEADNVLDLVHEPITIGDFLDKHASSKTERAQLQHYIWLLVAGRMLFIDLSKPLNRDTVLHLKREDTSSSLLFFNSGQLPQPKEHRL